MHEADPTYVSAAGKDWLLPFYDLFTKLLGVQKVHRELIYQAAIHSEHRVLEIGCGTGNMAILAKKLNPSSEVVAIDPDSKALTRASRKAQRARILIEFDQEFSEELRFPQDSFDKVLSAFMLHHVWAEAKLRTLQEALRVLKPEGSLHLVDFEERNGPAWGLHNLLVKIAHSGQSSSHHDVVLELMTNAGFDQPQVLRRQTTLMGGIVYYKATKVASGTPTSPDYSPQ
jgi:ubiquinone/menaquinone biosynthesis C-methylase UbiE